MSPRMLRVGLTGPAGSGKSTVAAALAARGIPVVDADRVAHTLYVPGSDLVGDLVAAFGDSILYPDGTVDREALGRIVFARGEDRARLNRIVHPRLVAELTQRLDALEQGGARIAVLDAALLLQWDAARLVDVVIGVWAPRETRRARLVAGGLAPAAADQRLDAQVEETLLRQRADRVLENTGSLAEFLAAVSRLAEDLERRAGSA
jgi:dephospho-CoA kinase